MKNLNKYWQEINFDYLKTYSGLRGEKLEVLEQEIEEKVNQLKEDLKTARFMQKPKINKKIRDFKNEVDLYNSRIVDKNEVFHKTTIEITRKEKSAIFVKNLGAILNEECEIDVVAACLPVFRDAIVFYSNKDEIRGILQICFGCAAIKNENEERIIADYKSFDKLANLLKEVGHPIE